MLEQLRRVTQAVSLAQGKQNTLDVIVTEICDVLEVEVCSVYLADYQANQFVLMANRGLNAQSIGQIKLDFNQGLVGLIGQREEPIHLQQAKDHPAFAYIPDVHEDEYNAFLGVPIIHQRKVLGVLVIQQRDPRQFELDEETFLITLAAQLSVILSNSQVDEMFEAEDDELFVRMIRGVPASSGLATGAAKVLFPSEDIHSVPDRKTDDIKAELTNLNLAVKETLRQLKQMSRRMQGLVSEQELSLFDVYQQILGSRGLSKEVEAEVRKGIWAGSALRVVVQRHLNAFRSMQDPYLRERANDIEDLANRVLSHLLKGNQAVQSIQPGTVIVAETITASMLAELPVQHVVGIVSLRGSSTSHAAILAKALGIPAIMGMEACPVHRMENKTLIVDGYNGQLYINPNQSLLKQYQSLIAEEEQLQSDLSHDHGLPNATRDGQRVRLMVNSSQGADFSQAKKFGADGVGLYRTEIPFMQLEQFPSEKRQVAIYRELLESFKNKPVVIRTLDIGGDKQLSYFPIEEENPFLGWRGVRVTLDHPEIFLVQLRAIFKASAGLGEVKLALPMVTTLEELDESFRLINQAFAEVEEELKDEDTKLYRPKVGLILEVPATLFQLSVFAQRVDFVSVGTNDLIQYMMAVDRNNMRVKNLYSHFQPAVLSVLKQIASECKRANIPLQICGEMAADPLAALILVGMGYDELSINMSCLARVKRAISRFDLVEMQQIVDTLLTYETEAKVKDHMLKIMEKRGLGGLVRAGI
ncbi:phosphoenolpyruvate--protein phosphotransferase [Aliikangiella marina]|uniref:phosphoenolpyruvate--protein phosphotransferase n=1 Tax=Aliikangiella marina TaxID=1712262 RepID=A0A545T8U0_9GAMM|nr:phosphoenolpyruvate--protein phosphotransferase [Aliikangiella marina]TQV73605.1 phosphoenolpyruvate--protein phosphotransferase [Aliikangiella marina]